MGEIERMIECTFGIVQAHLSNFCEGIDLIDKSGRFFEEQYILFERNLTGIEKSFPNSATNRVVNTIREKTLSYFEPVDARHDRMKQFQASVEEAWKDAL